MTRRDEIYNTNHIINEGSKCVYNVNRGYDTMIMLGDSLSHRATKLHVDSCDHANILTCRDGARDWGVVNYHLPTAWTPTQRLRDSLNEITDKMQECKDRVGNALKWIAGGDVNLDLTDDEPCKRARLMEEWFAEADVGMREERKPERAITQAERLRRRQTHRLHLERRAHLDADGRMAQHVPPLGPWSCESHLSTGEWLSDPIHTASALEHVWVVAGTHLVAQSCAQVGRVVTSHRERCTA